MNLADAIRQATQKAPSVVMPTVERAEEEAGAMEEFSHADPLTFEATSPIPRPEPAPQAYGGNVVRLELFLAPEQLNALIRAAVTNHHSMMTSREAAAYLRIHTHTVEDMAQTGKIPALLVDGKWRFLKASIDEWVTHQRYRPEESNYAA